MQIGSTLPHCKFRLRLMGWLALMSSVITPALAAPASLLGGLAIDGYDPVLYVTQNKAVPGNKQFLSTSDYRVYYFSSAATRDVFMAEPEKYTPFYGGFCAYQASEGRLVKSNPQVWVMQGDGLFFFANAESRDAWYIRQTERLAKAQQFWDDYKHQP